MKKYIFRILIFVMLSFVLTCSSSQAKEKSENTVYADRVTLSEDGSAKVYVRIRNNQGIMGFRIRIQYDSDELEVKKITQGGIMDRGIFQDSLGQKDGEADILWSSTEDMKKNGVLFSLLIQSKRKNLKEAVIRLSYSQEDTFNEDWKDVELYCKNIQISEMERQESKNTFEPENAETTEEINEVVNEAVNQILQQEDLTQISKKISMLVTETDTSQEVDDNLGFSALKENQQKKIAKEVLGMYVEKNVLNGEKLSSELKVKIVQELLRRSDKQEKMKTINVSKEVDSQKEKKSQNEKIIFPKKNVVVMFGIIIIFIIAIIFLKKRKERCTDE